MECTKRRLSCPLTVQFIWDAVDNVRQQKKQVSLDRILLALKKAHDFNEMDAKKQVEMAVKDNLLYTTQKVGCKGNQVGIEQTIYHQPNFLVHKDGHDWYCFQCHRGGSMLCCSECFRVFHDVCCRKDMQASASKFICPVCTIVKASRPLNVKRDDVNILLGYTCNRLKEKVSAGGCYEYLGRPDPQRIPSFTTAMTRLQQCIDPLRKPPRKEDNWRETHLIYNYVDIMTLENKTLDRKYRNLEEFEADVQNIVHNVVIYYGVHSPVADMARQMLRDCTYDLTEIRQCTDCYRMSNEKKSRNWFCQPCNPPHELVYAKQKGYSFWPAKVIRKLNADKTYDVRFFGGLHERANVEKSCIKPITSSPNSLGVKRSKSWTRACDELKRHQKMIAKRLKGNQSASSGFISDDDDSDAYSDDEPSSKLPRVTRRSSVSSVVSSKSVVPLKRGPGRQTNVASRILQSGVHANDSNVTIPKKNKSHKKLPPIEIKSSESDFEKESKRTLRSLSLDKNSSTNAVPNRNLNSLKRENGNAASSVLNDTAVDKGTNLMKKEEPKILKEPLMAGKKVVRNHLGRYIKPSETNPNKNSIKSKQNVLLASNGGNSEASKRKSERLSNAAEISMAEKQSSSSNVDLEVKSKINDLKAARNNCPSPVDLTIKDKDKTGKCKPYSKKDSTDLPDVSQIVYNYLKINKGTRLPLERSVKVSNSKTADANLNGKNKEDKRPNKTIIAAEGCSTVKEIGQRKAVVDTMTKLKATSKTETATGLVVTKKLSRNNEIDEPAPKRRIMIPRAASVIKKPETSAVPTKSQKPQRNSNVPEKSNNPISETSNHASESDEPMPRQKSSANLRSNIDGQNSNAKSQGSSTVTEKDSETVSYHQSPISISLKVTRERRTPTPDDLNVVSSSSQVESVSVQVSVGTQTLNMPKRNAKSIQTDPETPPAPLIDINAINEAVKEKETSLVDKFKIEKEKALESLRFELEESFTEEKAKATADAISVFKKQTESVHALAEENLKISHKQEIQAIAEKHQQLISETKKKQWCYNCETEAIYHCCWNTSYCSLECQQSHWQKEHKKSCRRKR